MDKLDEQEQRNLLTLFQAFLALPNAATLRLHFYADTGGGLTDTSGATKSEEKLLLHWLDMEEGVAALQAYRESLLEQEEEKEEEA